KYSVCTTIYENVSKGYKDNIFYEFEVDNLKKKGYVTNYFLHRLKNEVKVPNGKYLVIYSIKNPKINIIVENRPVLGDINLDSLNSIGVNSDYIDWND
ncbi:MAG: hypothetical protein AAF573_20890, partial [Bacteroidota bacterium]